MWKSGAGILNSTALSERIDIADPGAADGLAYPQLPEFLRELIRRVIAAAVTVKYSTFRKVEIPGRHTDRLRDERCLVIIVHRPAGYLPGCAVDNRREVKPALPGPDISNIPGHLLARPARGE